MPAPVISVSQMRDWEKTSWSAGKIEAEVIDRVGEIVARRAHELVTAEDFILILAGKGNNGSDARRAREHLDDLRVETCEVNDPQKALPELNRWLDQEPALIVDGLFGIGLNRPLDEHWQTLIQRVNESPAAILAVDVPSGLNADTGEPQGAAVRATVTLTLGAPKNGMLLPAAWPFVGRLEVASEIGLVKCPASSELNWTLPEDFKHFPPARKNDANKGNFGRLAIIAGSHGYHGAAVLTSRGAQRAQPGLITLHTQEDVYQVVASQLQAVMVSAWLPALTLPGDYDAVLIGPGLAAQTLPEELKRAARQVWLESPVPVVVDASALDWLPHGPVPENAIRVITPHPGEAGRLLQTSAAEVQANRPKALREISKHLGNCWVILKGAQTLIGRSTGEIRVNPSGNPHLAQGGSGDLLSGFLAGLLAQPALQADALKTLCYGVWQHGAAADRLQAGRANWVVEDLVEEIGAR
jgi:NAD(P)H-hydrate epimerase